MTVEAKGDMGLISDRFTLDSEHLRLADLDATPSEMAFRSSAPSRLRIETNSFDLATLAGTLPFLGSYRLTGNGQARVRFTFGNGPFSSDGSVSLKDASVAVVVVVPDIPKLAERIALGALNVPGRIIRGGVNGLSNLIGGGSSSGTRTPSSSNPLDQLKGLLP